jgi:hypothetical protein
MRIEMKQRDRVFRRGWGTYYVEDLDTKKQRKRGQFSLLTLAAVDQGKG